MIKIILVVLGFVLALPVFSQPAKARFVDLPGIKESLAEPVRRHCRVRRERVERRNGTVIYRKVRRCRPRYRRGRDCRVRRERVHRPNGTVIYRKVRRCR